MILSLLTVLAADSLDSPDSPDLPSMGTSHVTLGNRLDADGKGTAVGVSEEWVVGGDGGTLATRVSARWAPRRWALAFHLPFATYRTPQGRTTGLGNLRLDAFHRIQKDDGLVLVGASVHLPLGRAYTWTNAATGMWPGGGLTGIVQLRRPAGPVELIARGAVGVHGTQGFDPYPEVYLHGSLAGGIDVPVGTDFGVLAEAALSGWDPSPIEASVWARLEPASLAGFRGRFGMLFPIAAWTGLSPSDKPAGARELSLMLDIGLAL